MRRHLVVGVQGHDPPPRIVGQWPSVLPALASSEEFIKDFPSAGSPGGTNRSAECAGRELASAPSIALTPAEQPTGFPRSMDVQLGKAAGIPDRCIFRLCTGTVRSARSAVLIHRELA